jgi:hypothetical protein
VNLHPDIEAALEVAQSGALRHHGPGRTDDLNISVPGESYVVPADVVSALGQGNTEAGFKVLERFWPTVPEGHAAGGNTGKTPIVAAGGEYIVHPEHIKKIGGGNMKRGHRALEDFVKLVRNKTIKKLKGLPGPHR